MTVRAKFKVHEIATHSYGGKLAKTVKLQPVVRDDDPQSENTKFWQSTPTGRIELGTINMDAATQFEINGEYYVTFEPVEPAG